MKKLSFFALFIVLYFQTKAQDEKNVSVQLAYKNQIEAIGKDRKVQKAFDAIQSLEPQTMKDLVELTEIPAPPFMEQKRGERFMQMVKAAGADSIWKDEVGNVLALKKGKTRGRTVVLEAHLDTVFPLETDVKVKKQGDTLYAPGIGDDTRGLAMVLAVMKAINSAQIQTSSDVLFAGVVGEEGLGDLRGVKHLFKNGNRKIDAYIAIDGGDLGRINNMALGSLRYKVT